MSIKPQKKTEIITQHRRHEKDSGSPEVQVAVLSEHITSLTEHMKTHKSDMHSRRGLLAMVSKRRSLLRYLKTHNSERHAALIKDLGLRG